jgi:hypothetical protein
MTFALGLFGHLSEWEASDRRGHRVDTRPTRMPEASRRRRRSR